LTLYVIDASVMGPLIVADEAGELVSILPEILASGQGIAPQHWRLEVANLARMAVRRKRLTEPLLAKAFVALSAFEVMIDPQTDARAWNATLQLATKYDLTAYDAAYIELAGRTGRTLLSRDKKLLRTANSEKIETHSQ
jgi:predicted nucleic acid-binding protein